MTTELTLLAWTLVLAFVQILLFDFARTGQYGLKWNTGARDEKMPPLKPEAERLKRAQDNLFETLPLFIGFVLIAHVAGDVHGVVMSHMRSEDSDKIADAIGELIAQARPAVPPVRHCRRRRCGRSRCAKRRSPATRPWSRRRRGSCRGTR
mgnify:CR=1 FL=1